VCRPSTNDAFEVIVAKPGQDTPWRSIKLVRAHALTLQPFSKQLQLQNLFPTYSHVSSHACVPRHTPAGFMNTGEVISNLLCGVSFCRQAHIAKKIMCLLLRAFDVSNSLSVFG
jgi:hypothetical protein